MLKLLRPHIDLEILKVLGRLELEARQSRVFSFPDKTNCLVQTSIAMWPMLSWIEYLWYVFNLHSMPA
jgi:hypothetical protein